MTKRFSDDSSQAIFKRALEIDALSADGLSSAQLEAVASELGISPLALAKAMNEHGVSMVMRGASTPAVPTPGQSTWAKAVAAVVIALIAAFTVLIIVFTRPATPVASPEAPAAVPAAPVFVPQAPRPSTKGETKKRP